SLVSSRFGAKLVLAVDASMAVEAAKQNSKLFDNIHVIQADLHHLPFRQKQQAQIDFIFCIGVLHHLDVPKVGFEATEPAKKT
ncbi:MAG: class I SAM-dependent methyltransferase, partial [Nostocales cyanobacterium W4_Combined_metabat2_030]|nr:class I SAM-dependent methyltransferase [Nostocales cyanobacterium W4_Combined_metabat2_030]